MGWLADGVALTAESCTRDTATLEGVRDRAGHGFFMKDEKLYIHAGYDSQHNVLHDLVEVDVSSGTSRNHARAHTHAQTHHCSPWQADGFSTRTIEYKSVLPNLERRWHCNFLHDDRYFVHGGTPPFATPRGPTPFTETDLLSTVIITGWNDSGGLADLIYLDLSTFKARVIMFCRLRY
jgi:hypothetical protein